MHQIVYASSSRHILTPAVLNEILEKARASNAAKGITGLLLYNDGNFLQVLEGDKQAIHDCYANISQDSRHHGIIKLLDEPISHRSFENWAMAFQSYDDLTGPQKVGFSNLLSLSSDEDQGTPSNSKTIVRNYLKNLRMG